MQAMKQVCSRELAEKTFAFPSFSIRFGLWTAIETSIYLMDELASEGAQEPSSSLTPVLRRFCPPLPPYLPGSYKRFQFYSRSLKTLSLS